MPAITFIHIIRPGLLRTIDFHHSPAPTLPPRLSAYELHRAQKRELGLVGTARVPEPAVPGYLVSRSHYAGRVCSAPMCGERIGLWSVSVGSGISIGARRWVQSNRAQ